MPPIFLCCISSLYLLNSFTCFSCYCSHLGLDKVSLWLRGMNFMWLDQPSQDYVLSLASFPGPAQLSVAFSMEKWERTLYFFSREWLQDRKDSRKGLIVCGCTRPRRAKRAKVWGNLPHVSSYQVLNVVHTKCSCWKYMKRSPSVL